MKDDWNWPIWIRWCGAVAIVGVGMMSLPALEVQLIGAGLFIGSTLIYLSRWARWLQQNWK